MLPLAVLLILFSIVLFWLATRQQKIAGLPAGRVIYSDTSRWAAVEKPLYDAVLGLAGKPDYLVETGEAEGGSHHSGGGQITAQRAGALRFAYFPASGLLLTRRTPAWPDALPTEY